MLERATRGGVGFETEREEREEGSETVWVGSRRTVMGRREGGTGEGVQGTGGLNKRDRRGRGMTW